jgi:outer membrane receptor protein involved in Fe transport
MASTIFAGASALAVHSAASAQTTTTGAPSADASVPQEVVVTGTRIRQPNLTSVSPLTVVTDQEIKLSGASNIENLLNGLPQITAGQQSNVSNGSTGTATVDLRSLGPRRTLVLVDGKRLMPGDPSYPVADLNNIPSALVERVDVVTGGASAVYGADAVAGVVNFIMKKNFQGAEIDAQYGFLNHQNSNDAYRSLKTSAVFPQAPSDYSATLSYDVSAIIGLNSPDDKGNITAYATYRNLQAITQDKFDVSACSVALSSTGKNANSYVYDKHICAGSSNSAYGRFIPGQNGTAYAGSYGQLAPGKQLHLNPDGSKTYVTTGVPAYNYGPLNYFQRPEDRYTAGFDAHYRFNEKAEIYSNFMFADDHTVAQIAPSGLFAGTGSNGTSYMQVNCNNPLIGDTVGPDGRTQRQDLCGSAAGTAALANVQSGLRFVGANRQDDLRHTNYKIDLGLRGEFAPGWSYDGYLQYGASIYSEEYLNDTSVRKIQNALLVDPTTGKCITDASNCVPLNIFQYGGLTKQALSYVLTPGFKSGGTTEAIADFSVTGDLGQYGLKSPLASNGFGIALGTEYRREALKLNVDSEFQSGDLSGQGGSTQPNGGSFDVYELFGEVRMPLINDKPFFRDLSLDIGYRFSDYSTAGTTSTYKAELDWSITRDIRFRAGYNRAVRAPAVDELYAAQSIGLYSGTDPCSGTYSPTNPISAACLSTFASAAASKGLTTQQFYNSLSTNGTATGTVSISQCPAAQCSFLGGGNLNLKPEQADTYTAGFVFTPTFGFLRRFTASVDYFSIEVDNAIGTVAPNVVVGECLAGVTSYCGQVHRDPSSGVLFGNAGYVISTETNTGYTKTDGFDFTANYRFLPEDWGLPRWGSLTIAFVGTYTNRYVVNPANGLGTYDCAGLYGTVCGTPLPHWKSRTRFTYEMPKWPVTISLDWRVVGAVKYDGNQGTAGAFDSVSGTFLPATGNSLLATHPSGLTDAADETIGIHNYFDLSTTWKVKPNLTLRAGVSNILDSDPPLLDSNYFPAAGPPTGNGNTYPGVYDSLGRTAFVGLTLDF